MTAEPLNSVASDLPRAAIGGTDKLPAGHPAWAGELADLYFSGTTCLFVLHGNVHDFVPCLRGGENAYCTLSEFRTNQVFGRWDIVLSYDLSSGLRPQAGGDRERLRGMLQYLTARWGEPSTWPREPDKVLQLLDNFIERSLVDDAASRTSIAILFDYAQYLVPAGDLDTVARSQAARLLRFLSWAQNPHIKRVNMAFCLVADKLGEVNERLVSSPHAATIEIPLPGEDQRRQFSCWAAGDKDLSQLGDFTSEQLAQMSNGLSLVNLNVILSQATRTERRVDQGRFRELKKTLVERQCRGLVEFVEPDYTLDLVVGHGEAKRRLQEDAQWIGQGRSLPHRWAT